MKKYFTDDNGGKFAVPEEEVEGFLKSAADEGKNVSEESVRTYRDAQGTVYDVPESDVEGFLKSAAAEGKEIEADAVANNAGQRVTRAVTGALRKAGEWMDEGSRSGEFLPTAAKGLTAVGANIAAIPLDTLAAVGHAVGSKTMEGMFAEPSAALPKDLPDYGHPALNKAAQLATGAGTGLVKYGALGAVNGAAVAADIGVGGVNTFKDTLATSLESGNGVGKSVGLAAAAAGISVAEAWALAKSALGPKYGMLGNMAETSVKMGAGEAAQDAVQRAARGEEQKPLESLKAGGEGMAEGAMFGALGGIAHAAAKTAEKAAKKREKAEAEAAVAESEQAFEEAEQARAQAEAEAAAQEAHRAKVSAIRGEPDSSKQLAAVEEMGVGSWEEAEAQGVVTKDEQGRYVGGARRSVNIEVNGTEALKGAVKEGRLSGETAEEILTLSQCEAGARPPEERARLVDAIVETAGGDEALARGIVEKIGNREEGIGNREEGIGNREEAIEDHVRKVADEVKAEAIAARNGVTAETARRVATDAVETADGTMTTLGEVVDADTAVVRAAERERQRYHEYGGITEGEFEQRRNAIPTEIRQAMDGDAHLRELLAAQNEAYRKRGERRTEESESAYARAAKATADAMAAFARNKLRERVEATINTSRRNGKVLRSRQIVEFSETTPEKLRDAGMPEAKIISNAETLRKIANKHKLTSEQIAEIPERYGNPVAVFRDGSDFIALTDMMANTAAGEKKPVMVYLKSAYDNGKQTFIASAYPRESAKEIAYRQWLKEGKLVLVDKERAASLGLEDATLLQLRPQVESDPSRESIANSAAQVNRPKPQTALEGAEQAARLKGTRLASVNGATLGCATFPEMKVRVSSEGVDIGGLDAVAMAKPENAADMAAVLVQAQRIADRNGIALRFESEEAMRAAQGIAEQVQEQGLARAQKWMDTRAKTLGLLMKNGLGTEVTYDEASFKAALASTENGRPFVDKHGDIYGFVDGKGGIHYNPAKLTMDIPFHENGHLAIAVAKKVNGKLIERGYELIKDTEYYREIAEMAREEGHPYHGLDEAGICEDALCNLLGRRMKDIIADKGVGAGLKQWVKDFWKAVKGALGIADLTEEQIENMTLGEIADAIGSELVSGREFGVRRRPSGLTRSEAAKARMQREEDAHYRELAEAEEEAQREAFIASGGTALDYIKQRIAEGEEAPFDLDWETMRELARDRAEGKFAARRLIGGKETAVSEGYPLTLREARDPEKVIGVLGKLIGKSAAQIGQMKLTRITEKSVEHLLNSGHAKSDRTANGNAAKRLWRGTVAGMSVTDDIIGTSPLGTAEAPKHFNAAWKKGAKFYSADTRFAIELDNGQYEIYPCKLIVSEVNGERQVYDITEIGKPTLSAIPTAEAIVPGVPQRGLTANGGIGSQRGNSISNEGTSGQVGKFAAGKKDQTETQQFKNWFAGSKMVDDAGKPLVVYHGTPETFTAFDKGRIKSTNYGKGFYFTSDRADAEHYANGGNVMPVYLSVKNPLDITTSKNDAEFNKWYGKKNSPYDGYIVNFDGKKMIVVTEPTQIKSATDNVGTFDAGNPDIRFAAGSGEAVKFDTSRWTWKKPGEGEVALGDTEQSPAGLAAGIEKREALRPWTKKHSPADLAKPIAFDAADMVMFWRAVSGSLANPRVVKGEHIPGRKNAVGRNVGGDRIEIASRLFGVVDAGDVTRMKEQMRREGYFRDENPDWDGKRSRLAIRQEADRSAAELDRRTRELYAQRVETGAGGEHYATQVLGHEIGHTLAKMPLEKNLGPVGNKMKTLFDEMRRQFEKKLDPLAKDGDKTMDQQTRQLIAWWHGQEEMPKYYEKPSERFAELFGIFLTQPESVAAAAPQAYDACTHAIASNPKLAEAYRRVAELKWRGQSNDAVLRRLNATWTREAQENYRKLQADADKSVSSRWDEFQYALNDRFGPMFGISKRSLKAERKLLDEAVREGRMSRAEADDRVAAKQREIDALKTSLYDWQRQSGGSTRLMIADFDGVMRQAEKDGVDWADVRNYAHLMRVVELGGRATAHGVDPARAAATLGDMANRLGADAWAKVEKTWKAYRAVYERFVLDDPNVKELFDEQTNKMLAANKHYVTMKHRMGVEEAADWQAKIDEYRRGNADAWDPCIDVQMRLGKGLGEGGFVLHRLTGSFEATEDPIAATMKRAIEIKEAAARNHLVKQTSETLRALGAKGVFDTAEAKSVDNDAYGTLHYMDGGAKRTLIVPKSVYRSFKADPKGFGAFGAAMRFLRNTMTLWNPAFVNRAYLIDKASLEANVEGLHKAPVDVLSEALCFRGVGVPLYLANNYLARFTPIAETWLGKRLWNENTVNHYAHRAQKIARIAYEGKFDERLDEARALRGEGETARAAEIEQNVAVAREMLRRNVFQSAHLFNRMQGGLSSEDILRSYGYRIGGEKAATLRGKAWEGLKAAGRWANRFEEEQEAVTKIVAYLYKMKRDAAAGRTGEADAQARARSVIEYGGTPNLAARGVFASDVENATGFFWNVRKEGTLRTLRAIKDHPKEWIVKNFAQTAAPALLKCLMLTGALELAIRRLFDDDEEKIRRSWWAGPVIEHARWTAAAMKCVPGYYQQNYNVIPLAKFGDEVLSMRVKYAPEEFAIQNAVHTAFQKLGLDPTDPAADWSTLADGMWSEFLPNLFGKNAAVDAIGTIVGPLVGTNPYDHYRQRNVYDKTTWEARWAEPGNMVREIGRNFWNYSPLGTFTTTFRNGQERKIEDGDVPAWLDAALQTPFVRMIPASMLTITSNDTYLQGLKQLDDQKKAQARVRARAVLADCIANGRLGGFEEPLRDLDPFQQRIAVRCVVNGWRAAHANPKIRQFKLRRGLDDPELRKFAAEAVEAAARYGD